MIAILYQKVPSDSNSLPVHRHLSLQKNVKNVPISYIYKIYIYAIRTYKTYIYDIGTFFTFFYRDKCLCSGDQHFSN